MIVFPLRICERCFIATSGVLCGYLRTVDQDLSGNVTMTSAVDRSTGVAFPCTPMNSPSTKYFLVSNLPINWVGAKILGSVPTVRENRVVSEFDYTVREFSGRAHVLVTSRIDGVRNLLLARVWRTEDSRIGNTKAESRWSRDRFILAFGRNNGLPMVDRSGRLHLQLACIVRHKRHDERLLDHVVFSEQDARHIPRNGDIHRQGDQSILAKFALKALC
jgi:hypothetical protein